MFLEGVVVDGIGIVLVEKEKGKEEEDAFVELGEEAELHQVEEEEEEEEGEENLPHLQGSEVLPPLLFKRRGNVSLVQKFA